MKNYDIKNAVNELSTIDVHADKKRIAFLVPNMFNRVKNGFLKSAGPVNDMEIETDNIINNGTNEMVSNVIAPTTISVNENSVNEVSEPKVEVDKTKEKNYVMKLKLSEIKRLQSGSLQSIKEPRRLLISTVFSGKLIANRKSKLINDISEVKDTTINDSVNTIDLAIEKYHELISERARLIESVKNIELEITKLVKENNLTQEQVSRAKVA